jgi:DNA repair photolyase
MSRNNSKMYHFSSEQKNPMVGCGWDCVYCAFRKLQQRFATCPECRAFKPHYHLERFKKAPALTGNNEFVCLCLNGDVSFASAEFILRLIDYCEQWYDRTFLIQSKNPLRLLDFKFPYNVILGTTIETDLHYIGKGNIPYSTISKAPHPEERYRAIRQIQNNDVHITIEPIMDFHPDEFVSWMKDIPRLKVINVGYDSRPELNHLPEPPLEKTLDLITKLETIAEVRRKQIRPAWYEKAIL